MFSKTNFLISAAVFSIITTPVTGQDHEPGWKNLPKAQKHSPGHIEIPAKLHSPSRDINMLTVVKTDNYIQHHDGTMEYVNVHRYGEIFVLPVENITDASLSMTGDNRAPKEQFKTYLDYRSHFFEGGYFKDKQAMEDQVSGDEYTFNIEYADGKKTSNSVSFTDGDIPGPVHMSLYQDDKKIEFTEIDYSKDLSIRWTDFSDGKNDPNNIMDHPVTIMVNKCDDSRKRVYVSGVATLNATYLTHEAKEAIVPAETLEEGKWYWIAGEFSNVVHTSIADGAPAQAAWMNSVLLSVATSGASRQTTCKESMQRFD